MRYIILIISIILPQLSFADDVGYTLKKGAYVFDKSIQAYIPENYAICRTAFGNLNLDSHQDVAIILCHKEESMNNGYERPLLLFTGTKGNKLKYRTQEKTSVLTADGGGISGDPLQDIAVKDGVFTVTHYGGSNWRWSRNISFKFNKSEDKWFLDKVVTESFHINNTDKVDVKVTTVKDFGKIAFEDYNKLNAVLKQRSRKASYDCTKAGTPIEHAVCDSKHLGAADIELAKLYRKHRKTLSKADVARLKKEQRSWLKERNKNCQKAKKADVLCLYKAYADRLVVLTKQVNSEYGKVNILDADYARRSYAKNKNIKQDKAMFLAVSSFSGQRFFPDVEVKADFSNADEVVFTFERIQQHDMRSSELQGEEYFLLINNKGEMWYASGTYLSFREMFPMPSLFTLSNKGKDAPKPESLKKWIVRLRANKTLFENSLDKLREKYL